MLILPANGQGAKSVVAASHMLIAVARVNFGRIWGRMTAWILQETALPGRVRKKKVILVRCQLDKGTYSLNERLNLALDRLIEDLVAKSEPGGSDGQGAKRRRKHKSQNLGR
ncbi:MAG: hypothetical protein AMJ65_00925 [Phycisphaerae bacterium SG8_4]|nr:MAG: hypothetical protein AMJ65_00925 [Phycisphaerae bacterium SG8_4]